jgi:hypothetical protein
VLNEAAVTDHDWKMPDFSGNIGILAK